MYLGVSNNKTEVTSASYKNHLSMFLGAKEVLLQPARGCQTDYRAAIPGQTSAALFLCSSQIKCDTTGKLSNMRLTIKICQTTYVSMKHSCFSTYTFSNCSSFVGTFLLSSFSACGSKLYLILLAPKTTISYHTSNRRAVIRTLSRSFEHANGQGNSVTAVHQL